MTRFVTSREWRVVTNTVLDQSLSLLSSPAGASESSHGRKPVVRGVHRPQAAEGRQKGYVSKRPRRSRLTETGTA